MTPADKLTVVVLTSRAMGVEIASELTQTAAVRSMTVLTAPIRHWPADLATRVRKTWQYGGMPGLLASARARLRRVPEPDAEASLADAVRRRCPRATHLHFSDFHHGDAIGALRALAPDLGVVFATAKLQRSVYSIPRLGSINLHLGRAPEFRGNAPGFHELLNGVPEVGITVHRVSETLDGGDILLQRGFPLDLAPAGDPIAYLHRHAREVLVPEGARLVAEAVRCVAAGTAELHPQDHRQARTYRQATYAQKRALRRAVAARRRAD